MGRLRHALCTTAAAILVATLLGCGAGVVEPLGNPLVVRVIDDTVRVALSHQGARMDFSARLELTNTNRDFPVAWGGCGSVVILRTSGEPAEVVACATSSLTGRSSIAPGQSVIVDVPFQSCRALNCSGWQGEIDGDYRIQVRYGVSRPAMLEDWQGRHAAMATSDGVFTLRVED